MYASGRVSGLRGWQRSRDGYDSRVDSDQRGDGGALTGLTSTSGYPEQAAVLARRYESVTFEAAFGPFLPYLPVPPCRVA